VARVLLGWELGAGSGHAVKLVNTAKELRRRGHQPVFAAQHIGGMPWGEEVWQAPLWPRQLASLARPTEITPATMGDILAVLGLDDGVTLRALIAAWDHILAVTRPDAVVAEFAPGLMLAVRGRVPSVAVGTGFSLPPSQLPIFPSLTRLPAVRDEGELLGITNAALRANDRPELPTLPDIFAGQLRIPAVFRELDPYREWRVDKLGAPSLTDQVAMDDTPGTELFVYMNGSQARPNAFWQGLVAARIPTRVYDVRLNSADKKILRDAGLIVEDAPVPFDQVIARSRMVMSHGGMGLTCSALLAGIPHFVIPFDIEKRMIAASLIELGLGLQTYFHGMEAAPFAQALREGFRDDALLARTRAAAAGFQARMIQSSEEETVDAVEAVMA
jgi:rhamnosyltransferase subunit B